MENTTIVSRLLKLKEFLVFIALFSISNIYSQGLPGATYTAGGMLH